MNLTASLLSTAALRRIEREFARPQTAADALLAEAAVLELTKRQEPDPWDIVDELKTDIRRHERHAEELQQTICDLKYERDAALAEVTRLKAAAAALGQRVEKCL